MAVLAACFVVAPARAADDIDPCQLLTRAELAEIGIGAEVVGAPEKQGTGNVSACRYATTPSSASVQPVIATVILSAAGRERVAELGAMIAKATADSSAVELKARGEFYQGSNMCRVRSAAAVETSQCVAATDRTIVAFSWGRTAPSAEVTEPALQLRVLAGLVSKVKAKGG